MLQEWTVGNFKSVREPETLELAPLTIFSGANSSGKSTIIQSLLMVAQSLSPESTGHQLILNGKYVSLGDIEDVLHWGNEREPLQIGCRISDSGPGNSTISLSSLIDSRRPLRSVAKTKDKRVPWVRKTQVEFYNHRAHGRKERRSLYVRALRNAHLGDLSEYATLGPEVRERIKDGIYDYVLDQPPSRDIVSDAALERVSRASVPSLLPNRILIERNAKLAQLYEDMQWLINMLATISSRDELSREVVQAGYLSFLLGDVFKTVHKLPDPLVKRANLRHKFDLQPFHNWVIKNTGMLSQQSIVDELQRGQYAIRALRDYARFLDVALSKYKRQLPTFDASKERGSFEVRLLPQDMAWALDQIRQVLGQGIYYLGPLRADPSVLYESPEDTGRVDVGLKGEYTAAMLNEFRNMKVEYPLPIPEGEQFIGAFHTDRASLIEALLAWLARMGLVESVDTDKTPKVGYRLSVRSPGLEKQLDLTSVGVGVSQVLPTLVLSLLAPKGSILIFEQPELHLHPKVQSVLGDFFLGVVAAGKQCIIETHSEHIINRLLRRVPESLTPRILDQFKIYFVEKEKSVSRFRAVEPNEYGNVSKWPKGFFDEGQVESSALLNAQMEKRMRSRRED